MFKEALAEFEIPDDFVVTVDPVCQKSLLGNHANFHSGLMEDPMRTRKRLVMYR